MKYRIYRMGFFHFNIWTETSPNYWVFVTRTDTLWGAKRKIKERKGRYDSGQLVWQSE
jgi:hypothetical protein